MSLGLAGVVPHLPPPLPIFHCMLENVGRHSGDAFLCLFINLRTIPSGPGAEEADNCWIKKDEKRKKQFTYIHGRRAPVLSEFRWNTSDLV